ncbi:hypothetical protein ACP70R_005520 [Stipagrostis hirtigluma subsp. patula]
MASIPWRSRASEPDRRRPKRARTHFELAPAGSQTRRLVARPHALTTGMVTHAAPGCRRPVEGLGEPDGRAGGLIADSVLSNGGAADYIRFRAVCAAWCASSDDRFDPRQWVMLPRAFGFHDWR